MDFREATNELFKRVEHGELARELGVSIASIRQARLRATASAHRSAPEGWEKVVIRLALERVRHFQKLVDDLKDCK